MTTFKQWLMQSEGESDEKTGSISSQIGMATGYNDDPIQPPLRKKRPRKFTTDKSRDRILFGRGELP